ncbi:hypothetical protein Tco_0152735 [Tanacetum coccineum]
MMDLTEYIAYPNDSLLAFTSDHVIALVDEGMDVAGVVTLLRTMLCAYDCYVNDMSFGRICCVELSVWIFYSMDLLWFEMICDLPPYVLRMISEVELQALADLKSILYGLRSERFGIELCVELNSCRTYFPLSLAQVGNQGSNQGNPINQNGDAVNDNIQGNVRNVIVKNNRRCCTYKEFLACNPKEYDRKGGDIVYTRWIEKMESIQDMSGCEENQKVKYTAGSFVSKALTWASHVVYTNRFHELARLVPHLVTPENKRIERYIYGLALQIQGMVAATEPTTIQRAMQKAGKLTDKAVRNRSLKKPLRREGIVESLVEIGMREMRTRGLGLGMLLLQPLTQ